MQIKKWHDLQRISDATNISVVCVDIFCTISVVRREVYSYMGQCPAKSGLWGYNFITIKVAHCTKQHIFATVLRFPFKFRTLVSTPFLCVKFDFCDLHIFRAVDTIIVNPAG